MHGGNSAQSTVLNPLIGALAKATMDTAFMRLQGNREMLRRVFFMPLQHVQEDKDEIAARAAAKAAEKERLANLLRVERMANKLEAEKDTERLWEYKRLLRRRARISDELDGQCDSPEALVRLRRKWSQGHKRRAPNSPRRSRRSVREGARCLCVCVCVFDVHHILFGVLMK